MALWHCHSVTTYAHKFSDKKPKQNFKKIWCMFQGKNSIKTKLLIVNVKKKFRELVFKHTFYSFEIGDA